MIYVHYTVYSIVSETSEIVFIKSHDERLDLQREVTVTLTSSRHKGKRTYISSQHESFGNGDFIMISITI